MLMRRETTKTFDKTCNCYAIDCGCDDGVYLNEHGKYIVKYARNHGISISEAQNAPMVRAHFEFHCAIENGVFNVGTDWGA